MEAAQDPRPGAADGETPVTGRRASVDRRRRSTPRFSRYTFFGGRRRGPRRTEERDGSFVDVYSHALFAALVWIAFLNVADSFFTLTHLQNGHEEANPIAVELLRTGRGGFVLIKQSVITLALLVLCVHKNFPIARAGIFTAAGAYTLLLCYHLALFFV